MLEAELADLQVGTCQKVKLSQNALANPQSWQY
jgi:hypothetical protein